MGTVRSIRSNVGIQKSHHLNNNVKTKRIAPSCCFHSVGASGFLPEEDPLTRLPLPEYSSWEDAVSRIPSLIASAPPGQFRSLFLDNLPTETFPLEPLQIQPHQPSIDAQREDELRKLEWRAYSVLCFLTHAYMWGEVHTPNISMPLSQPPSTLPSILAKPLWTVAKALDMPPVLTYSTYNLLNWKRVDPGKPARLGNICCINNFFGGVDEEWFRLIHVEIEQIAAPMIANLLPLQTAMRMQAKDPEPVEQALLQMASTLREMQHTLSLMSQKCDPYIYYNRVRKPMSGWKNNFDLPNGLVYEGVSPSPLQYYGETGAQSPILHALDAVLEIQHSTNTNASWLNEYLLEMRKHMPPVHRAFLSSLEQDRSLRDAALVLPQLKPLYNDVVVELEKFRAQHKAFAYNYIAKFSKHEAIEERGTGGSDFMPALSGYQEATIQHLFLL